MSEIGQKLKYIRRKNLMTQVDLEKKSGINRATIIKIEKNGIEEIKMKTLMMITKALGIELKDLM